MIDVIIPVRSLLLAGVASMLVFPVSSTTAETASPQTIEELTSWESVKKIFRRRRRRPISRPIAQICLIAPEPTQEKPSTLVYNTKPFFLWKGNISKIAVGIPNKEYLKTQIVTGNQSVNYTGQALEPGKTYRLSIFLSELDNASPTMFIPFKIMEAPKRNRIGAELKLLEILQQHQGADAEKIAQRKAEYFAEKGLWSDALQQAFSIPNPSPELSQIIEDLPNQLCK